MSLRIAIRRAALAAVIVVAVSSSGCSKQKLKKAFFPWTSSRTGATSRTCS